MNNIILLIQVISVYCGAEGPGSNIEWQTYKRYEVDTSSICFKKIWECGHKYKNALKIADETNSCISKHIKGELK